MNIYLSFASDHVFQVYLNIYNNFATILTSISSAASSFANKQKKKQRGSRNERRPAQVILVLSCQLWWKN